MIEIEAINVEIDGMPCIQMAEQAPSGYKVRFAHGKYQAIPQDEEWPA